MGSFLGADILNQVTLVAPDGHWDTTNRSEWLVAGGQRVREDGQGRGAAVVVAAAGGDESDCSESRMKIRGRRRREAGNSCKQWNEAATAAGSARLWSMELLASEFTGSFCKEMQ
jgi:hypothetical protein